MIGGMTMRLPIVQFPRIVVENLGYFASVFQTTEQQKHFCEYVTGLIAGDKATIQAINDLSDSHVEDPLSDPRTLTRASGSRTTSPRRRCVRNGSRFPEHNNIIVLRFREPV